MILDCPPATVSAWIRRRARQALGVFHQQLLGLSSLSGAAGWEALFTLDPSVFDVIVHLKPPGAENGQVLKKVERLRAAATREAVAGLTTKLRWHLSPVCLVFHDADSRVIALKWRPAAFFPQHQNVLMGAVPHTMLPQEEGQPPLCIPNILCLTSVVASLAEGLALDVTVVSTRAGTLQAPGL